MQFTTAKRTKPKGVLAKAGLISKFWPTERRPAASFGRSHFAQNNNAKKIRDLKVRESEREIYFRPHISLWVHSSYIRLIAMARPPGVAVLLVGSLTYNSLVSFPQGNIPWSRSVIHPPKKAQEICPPKYLEVILPPSLTDQGDLPSQPP